ncbi:hypothetical protein SDC9_199366 [bioreactor metagenome]|uniref:Lysidine-tRNA(Ile) synthetase C-terminal domain-containing protein n=1 Tax=bioreactor metagenome TaxID=1076179 RepID=A0A645IKC5_9ZZZZ
MIDYDKIVDSVIIRTRKTKDKYVPLGFSGHRTIKKMMIDEKIPQPLRNILPVFESKGEILWVWGLRENAAFAAGCKTENLLLLEVYQD